MLGIRREDKNRWERRVPLIPDHVTELVDERNVAIKIQPSERRAFPDRDYRAAGAVVDEDLSDCSIVMGVKEIPTELLRANQAYLYFSHTTKGQSYNMPMLKRLLELGCTLLDYEQIVDDRNRRLVFFGRFAGYAGMIDSLWALGQRLTAEGIETPFSDVRLAHDYSGLDEATHHLHRLGERIRHNGLPKALRPFVVGFTGSGNVSEGAQEIYDRLPTQEILPEELDAIVTPERAQNVLYKVKFSRADRVQRRDGGPVDLDEFDEFPDRYESGMPRFLPHLTMLVHGATWIPTQPRLVSRKHLADLWSGGTPKLRLIADISCDIAGGVEATVKPTTPDNPTFVYDPDTGEIRDGVQGRGPIVMAVDNLPCQLPAEASEHFGDGLFRFIPNLARTDWSKDLNDLGLPPELQRAIIVHRGELTPDFAYLKHELD
ncbi:hypothetical protein ABI59_08705 [Acidobacteria bacterium Mor1]|nr:hypothetical protein ABI59_08705 [Acidobacteria bacterium Mor1]